MKPDHRKEMKADLPKDLKMDLQKEKGRESPKDVSYGLLKTNVSTVFPISIWTATLPELSGEKIADLRASWELTKMTAGFEVHGPAIFRM